MRGKRTIPSMPGFRLRNIPAYAGKTSASSPQSISSREHPRVCGENTARTPPHGFGHGTSPRMRGKHTGYLPSQEKFRNIPAYAGKTSCTLSRASGPKEHPRVCGENCPPTRSRLSRSGTSPRMRGKPAKRPRYPQGVGNIPAYAGKTGSHLPCARPE